MGTRNLTCVFSNGEYKVSNYGQWDGYPEGQGKTILSFLLSCDLNKFKEQIIKTAYPSDDKLAELFSEFGDINRQTDESASAFCLETFYIFCLSLWK